MSTAMSPLVAPGRNRTQGVKPRGTTRSGAPGSEPRAAGHGGGWREQGQGGVEEVHVEPLLGLLPSRPGRTLTLGASSSSWVARSLQVSSFRLLTTTSRQRRARGGTKSSHRPTSCQARVV